VAEKIRVRRSDLGRVRGLGSARSGTAHWSIQRISSGALIPLSLWFVWALLSLLGADQPTVAAWARHPLNAVLLLGVVFITFHHAQAGLQVVYEDYVKGPLRGVAILATQAVCLLLGTMAVLAVLKLFLSAR
jgi:succinate dehydrogenase / fumarate reductase membrane anchor subunit